METDTRHTLPSKIEAGMHVPKGSCDTAMALWLGPLPIGTPQRLAMIDPQGDMEFADAEAFALALAARYNAHDELVEALRRALRSHPSDPWQNDAGALLSRLEGGR